MYLQKEVEGLKIYFIMFTNVWSRFYNDLFVRNKTLLVQLYLVVVLVGYFCMNHPYGLKIKYSFLLLHGSPQLGSMLLSLQKEKYPVVWTWSCKSGSADISSATELLDFANELTPINTDMKKMCGWTCFYSWSTLISPVTSEALKDQEFWHHNFCGKKEPKGDSILLDKLLEYIWRQFDKPEGRTNFKSMAKMKQSAIRNEMFNNGQPSVKTA